MKDETKIWMKYAQENFDSATILFESKLFNPCLQNTQQCVEKALKSLFIEKSIKLKRTHSITELKKILLQHGTKIELTDDDCDFLDSIYLPSKYPLTNVLPFYEPNEEICITGIKIAERIMAVVKDLLRFDGN